MKIDENWWKLGEIRESWGKLEKLEKLQKLEKLIKLDEIDENWSKLICESWRKLMKIDEHWWKLKKLWKLKKWKRSKNWVKLHKIREVGWNCGNWVNWGKLRKIAKNCISSCRGSGHGFFYENTNLKLGEIGANWVKLG